MSEPAIHGPVPNPAQLAWHERERYGFVHFTMNTFTDREWGYGDEDPSVFAPTELDCRQWVAAAKAGGLTALILTAKHHDGFCLWPTATTTHNISRSPFRGGRGDVVQELADACREGGLAFGLYCSPWDRHHADYGRDGYPPVFHAQWRELLTRYGDLCELWFDGANGGDGWYGGAREKRSIDHRTYYRFPELWAQCRALQPNAMLFSDAGPDIRWCGNESGYTGTTCWAKVRPEGFAPGAVDDRDRLAEGDADGSVWRPVEVDVSIRPGWFWHANERPRSGDDLFQVWLSSVGRGAGLLLNLAPDRRGLIPAQDVAALHRFGALVEAFTALDLARSRTPTTTATASGDPRHLTDGRRDTWWESANTACDVVIELGQQERIAGVRLEEAIRFGQRVSSFIVSVRCWGAWFEQARGTTIGAQRILELPHIWGDAVRLRVLTAQAAPVLQQFSVYAG